MKKKQDFQDPDVYIEWDPEPGREWFVGRIGEHKIKGMKEKEFYDHLIHDHGLTAKEANTLIAHFKGPIKNREAIEKHLGLRGKWLKSAQDITHVVLRGVDSAGKRIVRKIKRVKMARHPEQKVKSNAEFVGPEAMNRRKKYVKRAYGHKAKAIELGWNPKKKEE